MKPVLALAFVSASLIALPAMAQGGGPNPGAPTAYAGASVKGFYDVDGRIQRIEQHIQSMGRSGSSAEAALRQIKAFERTQMARHDGQLRDWDRETINLRLDKLVGRYRITENL